MSFFNEDDKKKISKKIEESIKYRETLTLKQLREVIPKVKEFYLNSENKGFFNDGFRDFVIVKTPTDKYPPTRTPYGGKWWVQTSSGIYITLFGSEDQFGEIGFDGVACVTGRIKTKYTPINDNLPLLEQYEGKTAKETKNNRFCNSVSEMCRKFGLNEADITEDDYRETYNLNIVQVVK